MDGKFTEAGENRFRTLLLTLTRAPENGSSSSILVLTTSYQRGLRASNGESVAEVFLDL